MSKQDDVKVMLREAGILFAITLLSGLLLGFVYELTREPRRLQQEKAVQEACAAVFSGEEFKNVVFEQDSFELLQDILESAGELSERVDYEQLVATEFAKSAVK